MGFYRGHVICSSGPFTKNQLNKTKDKQPVSPKYRLCGKKEDTVMHLASGCLKLAQKQYKRRHDNVARRVHFAQEAWTGKLRQAVL